MARGGLDRGLRALSARAGLALRASWATGAGAWQLGGLYGRSLLGSWPESGLTQGVVPIRLHPAPDAGFGSISRAGAVS